MSYLCKRQVIRKRSEAHGQQRTKTISTPSWRPILMLRIKPTHSLAASPKPFPSLLPLVGSYPVLPTGQITLAPGVGRRDAFGVGPAHPSPLPWTGRADVVLTAGVAVLITPVRCTKNGGPAAVLACGLGRTELVLPRWDGYCSSEEHCCGHGVLLSKVRS